MSEQKQTWNDFIKKIPGWVTGLISLITAVVGLIKLLQGDRDLVTIVLLAGGVGGGLIGCAYIAFKREEPQILTAKWNRPYTVIKGPFRYHRWRPLAMAGLVIIPLLTASGVGYHLYQQAQPPTKVIILVANFDGPEPKNYRVTETVWESLSLAVEEYDDVQLIRFNDTFEESAKARDEGNKRKATIVIWGWYGKTKEAVPLSVHFEVLRPPQHLPELGPEERGVVRTLALAELDSLNIQTQL